MRIAVLGDIHGNLIALRAVLRHLRTQRPDALVVSGDLVYKLPWGAEVVDLLRDVPCHPIMGNAELYLLLWDSPLWPAHWETPLAKEVVQWERSRLGADRLAWLGSLPEYVAFSGGRLEDLLIVHGVPGNPFLPFLARPGDDRSPWIQTDDRAREVLSGVDADVVVCAHTHARLVRTIRRPDGQSTLVANPGGLSYGRGPHKAVGRAGYALLDWSARGGWQVTLVSVEYEPEQLHNALLAMRGDFPIAAYMANRLRPDGAARVPEHGLDFVHYRWGDAPDWWDMRDELSAWQELRDQWRAGSG